MIKEIYKPIKGHEGVYEISNLGKVRKWKNKNEVKSLKGTFKKDNFYETCRLTKNGISKTVYIHRLVAIAFIPNPKNKRCVNHRDSDRTNNKVENLEWCTHKENMQHAVKEGGLKNKTPRELSKSSKLTDEQVREIRKLLLKKTATEISKIYKVSVSCICLIKNKKYYSWVV